MRNTEIAPSLLLILALSVGLSSPAPGQKRDAQERGTPWDPALATPGFRIQFVEQSRRRVQPGDPVPRADWVGTTAVVYIVKGTGIPSGKQFRLWLWPSFLAPVRTRYVVHFGPGNRLLTEAGNELRITLGAYHLGERETIGLEATDGTAWTSAVVFPFPLQAFDRGCQLTLEMLTPDGTAFGAAAAGFPPGASVETVSRSDGEVIRNRATVPASGRFSVALLPRAVAGRMQASFAITAQTCSVKIDYPWGAAALRPQ